MSPIESSVRLDGIAIIGMAGRFPGARSVDEFWRNQLNGVESISHFRVEDLQVPNAAELAADPNYVRARSILEEVDLFDAEFFGILPREASLMDPQQRLFLESCWQCFEDAGYDPSTCGESVSVYAGTSMPTYFLSQVCTQPNFVAKFTGGYQVNNYPEMMGNSPDFLSTRISYKLNLRGPSFTMQSGCSTSLVAVTQACQALLTYQADMALAGGTSITFPQKRGSLYQEGGMTSPDGHCRTFDADASGTVFGSGVAVVLLKRLEEAVRDGDQIYAVISGFAANNDGSAKVGYTAPSIEGQSRCISLAYETADIDPASIGYIEAHGTGTPLGDPIELAALTKVFRTRTTNTNFCTIGTAKTNVGHLDVAAGVTGLIHASLIVRQGVFPPTLHFKKPNPNFDFENSPFRVNTSKSEWKANGVPRRAGVSAFGVGGTNAHVVIEQPPDQPASRSRKSSCLLVLSARSETALDRASENLAEFLRTNPDVDLSDAAWTLQVGRRAFGCRRTVVADTVSEAIAALARRDRERVQTRLRQIEGAAVSFLFPGQGSQYPNMGREIYENEPTFRKVVDRCAEILEPHLGLDLRAFLYPYGANTDEAKRRITETVLAQPAIFVVEYALAQLWMSWGIHPQAMLGHSIGEFVAACLSGVFSLEDALVLVATRGRLMQGIPPGGMLSVRLPVSEVVGRLNGKLSIAAVNSASLCVVAGPFDELESFQRRLESEEIVFSRLVTSHAFHSAMMDPVIEPFSAAAAKIKMNPPRIPYVSGVTGTWITEREATDPAYWARHLRQPVQFSRAISELRKSSNAILLEVGPGNVLSTLARQHAANFPEQVIVSSLSDTRSGMGDSVSLLKSLGSLWLAGIKPDWSALYGGDRRQRISLPTYPFERKRYWLERSGAAGVDNTGTSPQIENLQSSLPDTASQIYRERKAMNIAAQVAPTATPPSRTPRIRAQLVEIFEELSGMDLSNGGGASTFLEMGFDSLFLTQVTQALQTKFGLKIAFRQLLGDESTFDALADYLDRNLPPEVSSEPIAPVLSTAADKDVAGESSLSVLPTASAVTDNGTPPQGSVERLMHEQLQAMNQLFARQLDALRGMPANPAVAALQPTSVPAPEAKRTSAATGATNSRAAPSADSSKPFGPYKPPQKGGGGDILTATQNAHLTALVERYTKRTPKSKQLVQKNRRSLADPRAVSGFRALWKEMVYPLVTERSKGSRLWDIDGNEYIDIVNGFGRIMLGHRPDFVEAAIEKQLHEGFETGPQSPLAGEVAELFCQMTGNERMSFCNTGSEAVIAAMRVARTVTGRNRVVFFSGDYHGMFDEVLVKGFRTKAGIPQSVPIAPGIPRDNVCNITVLDYGAPESLEWIRQNANDLAAVLVEPVQSRHPSLQPVEFLKEIRRITEQSGAALIFDEVVTGFRVHQGGCQALFGIRADLATYGKVVAGGMPIGILAGKSQFMDALDGGAWQFGDDSFPEVGVTFFAGTFVRHPLTLAATKAVLLHFKEQGPSLQQGLTKRTAQMVNTLNEFLQQRNVPARIETFGSVFYLAFPSDDRLASLFWFYMREKGIHIVEGFPCFLTTSHSDQDIEEIVQKFKRSIVEMQEAQFLSGSSNANGFAATVEHSLSPVAAPMTEAQREIFLAAMLGEDASCSFNESFNWYLRGPLNPDALRQAVNAVIARHDALRATVDPDGSNLRFAPELKLEVPLRDLTGFEPSLRDQELKRILAKDAHAAFDLTNGPLVRAELLKIESDFHALHFTSHHIVCDGWSTNVIVDEMSKLYAAQLEGRASELPPVIPFSKYAQSQLEAQKSSEHVECESYWLNLFKTIPAALELPLDRPRASVKTYAGSTYRAHIGPESARTIKQLGSKNGCTLFVTLLAGFQALLHRLSNQNEIVVGIPTAGQSLVEDGNLVGHCVNFLPIFTQFQNRMSFSNLLAQVKKTVLDAYDHQSYTYGTLVRKLAIPRDPSRLPLMEVQFNLERLDAGKVFAGLTTEVDPNPKGAVNFDIFLNVVESNQGFKIDCDYNTDLFDEATMASWLKSLEAVLLSAQPDSNLAVDALPLSAGTAGENKTEGPVSSADQELFARWNETATDYPREKSIVHLFEEQVEQSPESAAVVSDDRTLTYRELNAQANRLAYHLRDLGVKPEEMVAICFERSVDLIVAIIGILKAGCAYVPLDPKLPKGRLDYILADTGARFLVTQKKLIDLGLSVLNSVMVALDDPNSPVRSASDANPRLRPTADNLAYTMYTSGSTGQPKGVMVEHRSVVRLVKDTNYCDFGPQEVILQFAPIAFDASTFEIWGALLNGGSLVVLPPQPPSLEDLGRVIRKRKVTTVWLTAGLFHLMVEQHLEDLRPLRQLLAGGDVLSPWHVRQVLEKLPNLRLINGYGPTEGTTFTCCYTFERDKQLPDPVPIGRPISNTRVFILDRNMQPVPVGKAGELFIGGDGIARGYLNSPELNAAKFITRQTPQGKAERLYRTGDLARFLPSGTIQFLGRNDNQVKLRGYRIELDEIEAVLRRHPAVRQACVIAERVGTAVTRLVAYYVVAENTTVSDALIREHLRSNLPEYMVPSAIVALEILPLTANGKVDRTKLPSPRSASAAEPGKYIVPNTPQEKMLADIVAEVLGIERVGVTDNLFQLGADSLHVFQITSRAVKAGLPITPRMVLQLRTIQDVLGELGKSEGVNATKPAAITPVAREKYRVSVNPE
jgi:amino acid adenylation domain-containing protein